MDIWIVWGIDQEYANDGELIAIFDAEEKAKSLAEIKDKEFHQQLRERGAIDHLPEKMKTGVSYYANGFPKHRISKHTVM